MTNEKKAKEEVSMNEEMLIEEKPYSLFGHEHLVGTIAYEMAERAARSFMEITEMIGLDNAGRILSVMEECEAYVNVSILEAVFAACGEIERVKDMEFLYDCAENAPNLFEEFNEYFMEMDEIDGTIIELIISPDSYEKFPGFTNRRLLKWQRQ